MITKQLTKGIVTLVCSILFLQPNILFGQWHSRAGDLPGWISGKEWLTYLIIASSGGVIMLVIPSPKPELHIKRADLVNKDGSFASRHEQAIARLRAFSKTSLVRQKSPGRTVFGTIRSVNDMRFVVETRLDSVNVPYTQLKEVYDLAGAAKLFKTARIKWGIFMSSIAAGAFYMAVITDHPIEGSGRAFNWATFSGFGALAAYNLIHKSEAENEYRIWQGDYAALSIPGKAGNGQRPFARRRSSSGFGVKLGLNLANISGENVKDTNSKIGFVAGGYFLRNLHQIYPSLAIQPEVLFSMKGYKQQFQSFGEPVDVSLTLIYLEIPVLARLSIPLQSSFTPHLLFGPALAVKLGSRVEVDGESRDINGVETVDWGMILGAGGRLRESSVSFEILYNLGLKSYSERVNVKNRTFSVIMGYAF